MEDYYNFNDDRDYLILVKAKRRRVKCKKSVFLSSSKERMVCIVALPRVLLPNIKARL